jgi:type VI secretion system protein VasG
MISVEIRSLLDHMVGQTLNYMHNAAGLCVALTNYEVTVEHLMLKALEDPNGDLALLLRQTEQQPARWLSVLTSDVESKTKGARDKPVFSPLLLELLQDAWLVSSLEMDFNYIRTGSLLLVLAARPSRYLTGKTVSLLTALTPESLKRAFQTIAPSSSEHQISSLPSPAALSGGKEGGFIARYCEDLSAKAKAGKLDPVFGRDEEIRQVVDILARRRKNNPILVADPGVGKTALIEGLAMRIASGDVPRELAEVTLLGLDLGSLEAGAGMKGEFENRLKGVMEEIKGSAKPIILFIDEAHTLIGAGGSAGASDAANLLKPALARGELRTCAATTWKEYKKYFEKDAALARRFQLVALSEPSVETTRQILLGLKEIYENAHGVLISDEALATAADYADRYISGRFQPDKSVDLLDTACARVKVLLAARPAQVEDCLRQVEGLSRHIASLRRDQDNLLPIREALLADLETRKQKAEAEYQRLEERWRQEKEAVAQLLSARQAVHAARQESEAGEAPEDKVQSSEAQGPQADNSQGNGAQGRQEGVPQGSDTQGPQEEDKAGRLAAAQTALSQAVARLEALQRQDEPLLFAEVGRDAIAKVVSDWTGVPLGKMGRDQASMVANLQFSMSSRIQGQNFALQTLAESIQVAKAGLQEANRPLGVFLLTGPSGTGKTETALALAEQLFGSERNLVLVNMGEFQEKYTLSRLVGSPPGYVGYGEGGLLTEAVRQKPYCVVLLDEVEKAHPDIMNLFYQVFDKGLLQDGEGKEVRFNNTVIILTSNLASDFIEQFCHKRKETNKEINMEELVKAIRPELNRHFKPALVGRMTVVPYLPLSDEAMTGIVALKLKHIAARLQASNNVLLSWSEELEANIIKRCTEVETGARNIDYILNRHVLPVLSRKLLKNMSGDDPQGVRRQMEARLSLDESGQYVVTMEYNQLFPQ